MSDKQSRQLLTRDDAGLLLDQRRFLEALAREPNWRKAAEAAEIEASRVQQWLRTDDAFLTAYNGLFGAAPATARKHLQTASLEATAAAVEALEAMRGVIIKTRCPECGHKSQIEAEVPDHRTRLAAAKLILQGSEVLKAVTRVEGITGNVQLTVPQLLALSCLKAGQPISEQMRRELVQLGLVGEEPYVEGEAREVE